MKNNGQIEQAAQWLQQAQHAVAFTGAGISANSGIPTFRGEGGIWKEVDPNYFNIDFFKKKPLVTWKIIKKVFYDPMTHAQPNLAHFILSIMEQQGMIKTVITQNIDHLHQDAGSIHVLELHGTYKRLICTRCNTEYNYRFADLNFLPPPALYVAELSNLTLFSSTKRCPQSPNKKRSKKLTKRIWY